MKWVRVFRFSLLLLFFFFALFPFFISSEVEWPHVCRNVVEMKEKILFLDDGPF